MSLCKYSRFWRRERVGCVWGHTAGTSDGRLVVGCIVACSWPGPTVESILAKGRQRQYRRASQSYWKASSKLQARGAPLELALKRNMWHRHFHGLRVAALMGSANAGGREIQSRERSVCRGIMRHSGELTLHSSRARWRADTSSVL